MAATATAIAGYKQSPTLSVTKQADGSGQVRGGVAVRNSANTVEYVGCHVAEYEGGQPWVYCYGKNSAGVTLSCSNSSDPYMYTLASAITPFSNIGFDVNASGRCTYLSVSNWSYNAPLVP